MTTTRLRAPAGGWKRAGTVAAGSGGGCEVGASRRSRRSLTSGLVSELAQLGPDHARQGLLLARAEVLAPQPGRGRAEEAVGAALVGREALELVALDHRAQLVVARGQPEPVEQRTHAAELVGAQVLVAHQQLRPGMRREGALGDLGAPQPLLRALHDEREAVGIGDPAAARELARDPRPGLVGRQ